MNQENNTNKEQNPLQDELDRLEAISKEWTEQQELINHANSVGPFDPVKFVVKGLNFQPLSQAKAAVLKRDDMEYFIQIRPNQKTDKDELIVWKRGKGVSETVTSPSYKNVHDVFAVLQKAGFHTPTKEYKKEVVTNYVKNSLL